MPTPEQRAIVASFIDPIKERHDVWERYNAKYGTTYKLSDHDLAFLAVADHLTACEELLKEIGTACQRALVSEQTDGTALVMVDDLEEAATRIAALVGSDAAEGADGASV